jgi:hypothetical protein
MMLSVMILIQVAMIQSLPESHVGSHPIVAALNAHGAEKYVTCGNIEHHESPEGRGPTT